MGAWIETNKGNELATRALSHPTWVRGLKHIFACRNTPELCRTLHGCVDWNPAVVALNVLISVAPYMGAWIETVLMILLIIVNLSHPTWVRGLKQWTVALLALVLWSHPTWVRGLKHYLHCKKCDCNYVAPYMGAWIETVCTCFAEVCK